MQDYRKLRIFHEAHQLTLMIYQLSKQLPQSERYGLISQMQRAAVSIPANLVEGCGRHAQGELAHFVQIAIASANELAYFLLLTQDLNYLETKEAQEKTDIVKKSLIAFQKDSVSGSLLKPPTSHFPPLTLCNH